MNFDPTTFYPSAKFYENSVYPEIETGYAFKRQLNAIFVIDFNNKTFNQDGNDSAILKTKHYIPPNLTFQHLTVKKELT